MLAASQVHSLVITAQRLAEIKKDQSTLQKVSWSFCFPTVGIGAPRVNSYLPYSFSVQELAPAQGKGIRVTIIDTGVYAFTCTSKGKQFFAHPDLTIVGDFTHEPHNTIPFKKRTHNPFENLFTFIAQHTKESNLKIRPLLLSWILEYLTKKSTDSFDAYIQQQGKAELFETNILFFLSPKKVLSAEGKRFKNSVVSGDSGFAQFSLATDAQGNTFVAECLPLVSSQYLEPNNDHGTHIASIIGARAANNNGFSGIAPGCSLRVIKAVCEDNHYSASIKNVTQALVQAHDYGTDIVNMSLSLDDTFDSSDTAVQELEKALTLCPYVCCAAGNKEATDSTSRLVYPARCSSVFFSVGSFGRSGSLSTFSRWEQKKGPHFVAPGEAILGCSYVKTDKDYFYSIQSGSSCATAFVTGTLALLLGEFKDDFTPDQIQILCKTAAVKLHNDTPWKEHVTYGTIDIRTALFLGHILKDIKKKISPTIFTVRFATILTLLKKKIIPDEFSNNYTVWCNKKTALSETKPLSCIALKKTVETLANNFLKENPFLSTC